MCGVFGYIGERSALEMCLKGLEQLEYRGYDSTGIAGLSKGALAFAKRAGKLSLFKQKLNLPFLEVAIAHTRWATHGKVSDSNAHPHFSQSGALALIHNGTIENFDILKEGLQKEGVLFSSDTDTEVVAHLVEKYYRGDLVEALSKTIPLLKGAFAFALIHKSHPDQIVAAVRDCPLSIAFNEEKTESIVSSDPNVFQGKKLNILFLQNNEIARVQRGRVAIFDIAGKPIAKKIERLDTDMAPPSKEGFEHYMLKEIFEQPLVLQRILSNRFDGKKVLFEELRLSEDFFKNVRQIWIFACGTSSHAGSIGALFLEEFAKMQSFSEIASEVRYRNLLLCPEDLIIGISQSGETADTLSSLREARKYGSKILALCNVKNSSLVREADATLFLNAGPEVSVCSTKAFTSQVLLLALFALYLGRLRGSLSQKALGSLFHELKQIPAQIQEVLDRRVEIETLAKKYAAFEDFFFMGRSSMFPTCLEAALKLKEISYANANGYPAGELKHGPIALLHPRFPVVAFCANEKTREKIATNLMEVKARGAPVLAFAPRGFPGIEKIADDLFWLPPMKDAWAPFCSSVAGQLFAYFVAKQRGCDIDQPRHLAKSVTVE